MARKCPRRAQVGRQVLQGMCMWPFCYIDLDLVTRVLERAKMRMLATILVTWPNT
jgi:hypothetical protein